MKAVVLNALIQTEVKKNGCAILEEVSGRTRRVVYGPINKDQAFRFRIVQ